MDKKLFHKYINNQCSENELQEITKSLEQNTFSEQWKQWMEEEWDQPFDQYISADNQQRLLDKIHHTLDLDNHQRVPSPKQTGFNTVIGTLLKIAAILLIPISIYLFIDKQKQSELIKEYANNIDSVELKTPIGSRSEITLSDGSVIYLNNASKVCYPNTFIGNTREVYLEGEAYFEVFHNPDKPFIVKTHQLNIKAIGTAFNVTAYPEESTIQTTLVHGKVIIEKQNTDQSQNLLGTMIPGQQVTFNKTSQEISSYMVNPEDYVAWKDGKLLFKDESIITVTKRLGRLFNVNFEFEDEAAKQYSYTATLINHSLYQILDLMKIATPIDYELLVGNETTNPEAKTTIIIRSKN